MNDLRLPEGLGELLGLLAVVSLVALVAALVLGLVLWRRLRKLDVRPGSGFWDTLRQVPLGLVVLLDLLDLSLDVLSTPIVWWILGRLDLRSLREVASVEALIPFTGPVPTMSICWALARLSPGIGSGPPAAGDRPPLEAERVEPGKWRVK